MQFDQYGLPKDNGATDWMDSARLAGINELFGSVHINLMAYIRYDDDDDGRLVAMRHPREVPSNNWKNFTRDQLTCLVAGLAKQGQQGTVRKLYYEAKARGYRAQNTEADYPGTVKKFPNGADLLPPSVMGHLKRAGGERTSWLQDAWLKMDIVYHGTFAPLSEPNQLISMCVTAGPDYVRMYKRFNKQWREGIRAYWCNWRNEPELAERMIAAIEKY